MRSRIVYAVEGADPTPDGYHDYSMYTGTSKWQVLRAVWAALRNDQDVSVRILIVPSP